MKRQYQLVWLPDKEAAGKKIDRGKYKPSHYTLDVAGDPPPGSEFLPPTFISRRQRKLFRATLCAGVCAGMFIGIIFILVVQLGLSGSDGDTALEESGNLTLPSNASDNCTLTYDPDDVSELVREAYVRTFFNVTCLATNGTGDPCDLHIAEEYTHRMFSALRLDRLVTEFLAIVAIFSLAQIGGIPRPTDWNGLFFWLAWMATMLAQYVVILCALILHVFSFLGVRARLSPCLIQVDGTALLDFYAMCTFAMQPELIIKATMLFVYAFLLSLGMLVFDGSRRWPWLREVRVNLTVTPNPRNAGHEDPVRVSLTLTAAKPDTASGVEDGVEGGDVLTLITTKPNTASDAKPGGGPSSNMADRCFDRVGDMHTAIKGAIQRMEKWLTVRFPGAARLLQSRPVTKAYFVEEASTRPIMPNEKRFEARVSFALCHYHVARTIVLAASFSMWAALGSPAAAPGVVSAWVLAIIVAPVLARAVLDEKVVELRKVAKSPWLILYLLWLILFCPFLSAPAILPLSALFMLAVQLVYFLAHRLLTHVGPSTESGEQVWINVPKTRTGPCCKWTDALARPTYACLSWISSTSIFSHVDAVLGRSQGQALAFSSTSYATLAGGLSCFWVLLALAPVASHIAWARIRSLKSSGGVVAFRDNTTLAVEDVDELTGAWSWVWGSLMAWLCLGVAIVSCCCLAGIELVARIFECPLGLGFAVRVFAFRDRVRRASLGALIIFIFTASQTADEKELIATTYASSLAALSGVQLDWNGALPSFGELVKVLNDPSAALSSVVQRLANLSSYVELDPAYFSEGVQALTAINLVLSFVKLLATYGRKLFALMDAAKSMLKTYIGHEVASEGDDGTVQVNETMTNLEAIAILDLLNKPKVKAKYRDTAVSFATLVLADELEFDECDLGDGDLAGVAALVTRTEMKVKSRSLRLDNNPLVTAQAWEKMLPKVVVNSSLIALNLSWNKLGPEGAASLAEGLKGNSTLQVLNLTDNQLCGLDDEGRGTYTAEGITKLCEALKGSAVTSLNLASNGLCGIYKGLGTYTTKGIAKLCQGLKGSSVTSLSLERNNIGAEGASALAAILKETQITNLNVDGHALPIDELKGTKPTEKIDLSRMVLSVTSAIIIASCIKENGVLKELSLKRNWLGPDGGAALAEGLKGNSTLQVLNLGYNQIGVEGASALAAILKETQITILGLNNNGIGDEGITTLAAVLKETKITLLGLRENHIGDNGTSALAAILKETQITTLDVGFNNITGDAADHLATVVLENAAMAEFCGIPLASLRENSITELDLKEKGVGVPGAIVLSKLLPSAAALTTLNLRSNSIGDDGASALAAILKETQITDLNLAGNQLCGLDGYGRGTYTAEGITKLCEALKGSAVTALNVDGHALQIDELKGTKPTEKIDLSGKGLSVASAIIIASCIKENGVLKELNLASNKLCGLGFRGNGTNTSEGITKLCEALKGSAVTSLNLGGNGIGYEGASALTAILKETQITKLILQDNMIGDQGASALAAVLKETMITHLDLEGNYIGDQGASALAAVLKETKITNLYLMHNKLNDEAKKAVKDAAGSGVSITF